MHTRTLRRFWKRRISKTEDTPTDTPYDLVRRTPHYQKRDYAFWFAFGVGMTAAAIYFIVDLVKAVR